MASTLVNTSLNSRATVQNGTSIDFLSAKSNVAAVMVVNGILTGGVIVIQASQNGSDWVELASMVPDTGINQFFNTASGAYRFWRASIIAAATGGGTVTVTFMEAN